MKRSQNPAGAGGLIGGTDGAGERLALDIERSIWAQIDGYDAATGRYSWHEVEELVDGQFDVPVTDDGFSPVLNSGTTEDQPAFEVNGIAGVKAGSIVRMYRGYLDADYGQDWRFDAGATAAAAGGNAVLFVISTTPDANGLLDGLLLKFFDCNLLAPIFQVAVKVVDLNNPRNPQLGIQYYTGAAFLCVRAGVLLFGIGCCGQGHTPGSASSGSSSTACTPLSTVYPFTPFLYAVDFGSPIGVLTLANVYPDIWQYWSADGSTFVSMSVSGGGTWSLSIYSNGTDYVFTGTGVCTAVYDSSPQPDACDFLALTLTDSTGTCAPAPVLYIYPASACDNCLYPIPASGGSADSSSSSGSASGSSAPVVIYPPISTFCTEIYYTYRLDVDWLGLSTVYLTHLTDDVWLWTDGVTTITATFTGPNWEVFISSPLGNSTYYGTSGGCCETPALTLVSTTITGSPTSITLVPYGLCNNAPVPPPPQRTNCPPLVQTGPAPSWFAVDLTGFNFYGNTFGTVYLQFQGVDTALGGLGARWTYGSADISDGLSVNIVALASGTGSTIGRIFWRNPADHSQYCRYILGAFDGPPLNYCAPFSMTASFVDGGGCSGPSYLTVYPAVPCDNCLYPDPTPASGSSSSSSSGSTAPDVTVVCGTPATLFATFEDLGGLACMDGITIPLTYDGSSSYLNFSDELCGFPVALALFCGGPGDSPNCVGWVFSWNFFASGCGSGSSGSPTACNSTPFSVVFDNEFTGIGCFETTNPAFFRVTITE